MKKQTKSRGKQSYYEQDQVCIDEQKVKQKIDLYTLSKTFGTFFCSYETLCLIERNELDKTDRIFGEFDRVDFTLTKNYKEIFEQADAQFFIFKLSVKGFQHNWKTKFEMPHDFDTESLRKFVQQYYFFLSPKLKAMTREIVEFLIPDEIKNLNSNDEYYNICIEERNKREREQREVQIQNQKFSEAQQRFEQPYPYITEGQAIETSSQMEFPSPKQDQYQKETKTSKMNVEKCYDGINCETRQSKNSAQHEEKYEISYSNQNHQQQGYITIDIPEPSIIDSAQNKISSYHQNFESGEDSRSSIPNSVHEEAKKQDIYQLYNQYNQNSMNNNQTKQPTNPQQFDYGSQFHQGYQSHQSYSQQQSFTQQNQSSLNSWTSNSTSNIIKNSGSNQHLQYFSNIQQLSQEQQPSTFFNPPKSVNTQNQGLNHNKQYQTNDFFNGADWEVPNEGHVLESDFVKKHQKIFKVKGR